MERTSGHKAGSRMLLQGRLETNALMDCHMHAEPHVPDRSLCLSSDLSLGQIDRLVLGTSQIALETIIKYSDSQTDSQTPNHI